MVLDAHGAKDLTYNKMPEFLSQSRNQQNHFAYKGEFSTSHLGPAEQHNE
jgi:hypothetical protein